MNKGVGQFSPPHQLSLGGGYFHLDPGQRLGLWREAAAGQQRNQVKLRGLTVK